MNAAMLLTRSLSGRNTGRICVLKTVKRVLDIEFDILYEIGFTYSDEKGCIFNKISFLQLVRNIILGFIFRGWSFNECLFFSNANLKKLVRFIEKSDISLLYIDSIRFLPYLERINRRHGLKLHLDFDDRLSSRYLSLSNSGSTSNVLGTFYGKVPFLFRKVLLVLPLLLKIESKLIARREKLAINIADSTSFVSKVESENFNREHGTDSFALPMSVDVNSEYVEPSNSLGKSSIFKMGFLGDMTYSGNINSLRLILNKYSHIVHDYGLRVIGKVNFDIEQEYAGENIEFIGYADDLRQELTNLNCLFVPMSDGGGVKTKILDAFSLSVPVISNFNGVEGLAVINGRELFICEREEESERAISLLKDENISQAMAENARVYLSNNFSFDVILGRWRVVFKKLGLS